MANVIKYVVSTNWNGGFYHVANYSLEYLLNLILKLHYDFLTHLKDTYKINTAIIIMCLNLPFEVKNQLTFYKVRWFKYTFCYSVYLYIWCFKNLWGSANILLQVPLKVGKKDFESTIFFEAQKYYFVFESRLNFFSKWSYSQRCFDVPQRCENRRWKW